MTFISYKFDFRAKEDMVSNGSLNTDMREGGSSIVKVAGDMRPARVYFFGLLV